MLNVIQSRAVWKTPAERDKSIMAIPDLVWPRHSWTGLQPDPISMASWGCHVDRRHQHVTRSAKGLEGRANLPEGHRRVLRPNSRPACVATAHHKQNSTRVLFLWLVNDLLSASCLLAGHKCRLETAYAFCKNDHVWQSRPETFCTAGVEGSETVASQSSSS